MLQPLKAVARISYRSKEIEWRRSAHLFQYPHPGRSTRDRCSVGVAEAVREAQHPPSRRGKRAGLVADIGQAFAYSCFCVWEPHVTCRRRRRKCRQGRRRETLRQEVEITIQDVASWQAHVFGLSYSYLIWSSLVIYLPPINMNPLWSYGTRGSHLVRKTASGLLRARCASSHPGAEFLL